MGIYYLAQGTDLKNAGVIYDRAGSSTAMLQPGQVDWDEVLKDISWFHFSAISPAVSKNLAAVCEEALKAAKEKKITISVDLNYRAKLWKWGKEPHEVMPSLIQYCDIVMGNIWAIERMAGIKLPGDFKTDKNNCLHQAEISSAMLMEKFSACKHVANTFRFDEGSSLKYYSTLYSKNGLTVSGEHNVSDIIDKVGSGDCFMAGLIYGFSNGLNEQQTLEFATAAAVDKMYVLGDATTSAPEKIKERIKNIQ
ncbi:MAG: sugar kinase [Chitinophagaceae bacterium]|nr:MAG: sugar kinase [Chitinophagaceae bacterium]